MEPDKCEEWSWHSFTAVPRPVFQPLQTLLDSDFKPEF